MTTTTHTSQPLWPLVPEPDASRRCDLCCWVWALGEFRLKLINRACLRHGRYLGAR